MDMCPGYHKHRASDGVSHVRGGRHTVKLFHEIVTRKLNFDSHNRTIEMSGPLSLKDYHTW